MPPYPPSHPQRSFLQLLIVALLLLAATALASARVDAQEPAYRLAGGDLGVAPGLVTSDTAVLSPDGTATGPDAVDGFVDSLRRDYPGAQFEPGEVYVYSGLMIVDWQGTIDDTVVVNGRTLIAVEDGRIVRLTLLNLNDVAPQADTAAASTPSETPSLYVIVDEQGATVVPEALPPASGVAVASAEARSWPNFDSTSIAT